MCIRDSTKPLDRLELKARIGMVERLVDERRNVLLLTRLSDQRSDSVLADMSFDSSILVPDFDRSIELMALELSLIHI